MIESNLCKEVIKILNFLISYLVYVAITISKFLQAMYPTLLLYIKRGKRSDKFKNFRNCSHENFVSFHYGAMRNNWSLRYLLKKDQDLNKLECPK